MLIGQSLCIILLLPVAYEMNWRVSALVFGANWEWSGGVLYWICEGVWDAERWI